MNIEANRRALVAALRSGEYTQTTGKYRSEDGTRHCALGVAADLFGINPYDDSSWLTCRPTSTPWMHGGSATDDPD